MQSNYLPPLEPIGDFRSYVCGDVVIDQTAAIASGVLIQADGGSKITIAAGACIGMGTVIHAQEGLLEIGAGASLGAGVLVYGNSKIGEGSCIGASSSIVSAIITKGAIVPPCSLISGLEQTAIEKEISPAIAQDLATNINNLNNNFTSPTSYSFTHTYSSAKLKANQIEQATSSVPISETQVKDSTQFIPEQSPKSLQSEPELMALGTEQSIQIDSSSNPIKTDDSALSNINLEANSAQAKAYAQAQINRYIKRLFPQN